MGEEVFIALDKVFKAIPEPFGDNWQILFVFNDNSAYPIFRGIDKEQALWQIERCKERIVDILAEDNQQ